MAASVWQRDVWVNDSGSFSAPNGDGTVLQNSVLQNHIYARNDAVLSGAGVYATLELGGLLKVDGFGNNQFAASGTGTHALTVQNVLAGTTNLAVVQIGNDAAADAAALYAFSSTYTTSGDAVQDSCLFRAKRAGGLTLNASNAAGVIRFFTNNAEAARITAAGLFGVGATAPAYQMHVIGVGQTTADLTDAGNAGAALLLQALNASAGDGGAVLFGAVGTSPGKHFAAIKAVLTDGTNNTTGNLAFSTRARNTDTNLTRAMTLMGSGGLSLAPTGSIVDPGASGLHVLGQTLLTGTTRLGGRVLKFLGPLSNDQPLGAYCDLSVSANSTVTGLLRDCDYQVVILRNTSASFTITLTNNDVSSAAGNRFGFAAGNLSLGPLAIRMLYHDTTNGFWRPVIDG